VIETEAGTKRLNPLVKLALELGPLVLFFFGNALADRLGFAESQRIFVGTAVFIPATLVALAIHYALLRKLPIMPLVSGAMVVVFGGLTLALQDALFIKLKPTIVNALFGMALLWGYLANRPLLAIVLDSLFDLTNEGWRKLTLRWALFFFFLAVLNEAVWRTQTESFWINFKVFGIMPITIAFALAQTPLLMRYETKPPEPDLS
jgi:intracellular septation protein